MKMKTLWAVIAALLCAPMLHAQTYKGKTEIGIQAGGVFFEGNSGLNEDGIYGARLGHYFTDHVALEANYLQGLTEYEGTENLVDVIIPTLDVQYHFGTGRLRPYLALGAGDLIQNPRDGVLASGGDTHTKNYFIAQWGLGLKWLFCEHFAARIDARHNINTEVGTAQNSATVTGGLSWLFGGSHHEEAKPAPVSAAPVAVAPVDTDGDGVIDTQDACPGTAAGTKVDARGCAIPVDTDGDGVTDDKDECAGTPAGTAVDAVGCPQQAKAVPVDNWVLQGVQFETGSDKLKPASLAALDEAAGILVTRTRVRVEIQGHSDSVGKDESNLALSQKRADSVKQYLVSKGVAADRLEAKGYGESMPVGDNATAEGRAKNRRIEFKVLSR